MLHTKKNTKKGIKENHQEVSPHELEKERKRVLAEIDFKNSYNYTYKV